MIKYIGSKRTLLPVILKTVNQFPGVATVLDLFSGTARVGHALKSSGYRVLSNDHNSYSATLARCYVQADVEEVEKDAAELVREFNALPAEPGYFTETFCVKSRFFQPTNGARVDAIRESIASMALSPELEAVMLVSLMEAADRVDSTTGLQMAYLKDWAPRSYKPLELRVPDLLPRARNGKGMVSCLDAFEAASTSKADLVYIDPPYNQHSYLGNYHIWESLVRWDKPEVYGIACKRVDVKERKSVFNSKPRFAKSLTDLLNTITAPVVLLSFSDEGYLNSDQMNSILSSIWNGNAVVSRADNPFKRYVGAQIGVYNLKGKKVGNAKHLKNTEYLYTITRK